jgi:ribose transport system permease protein
MSSGWRSLGAAPPFARALRTLTRSPLLGISLALVILVVLFSLMQPAFMSVANFSSLLRSIAFLGIIGVGQTVLMITGNFDLSVGSVAALGAVVGGTAMTELGLPVPVGIVVGLLAGAAAGLMNGIVTIGLRVPAFIATLGMLFVARGLVFVVSQGQPVYPVPPDLVALGDSTPLGIPFALFVFLALAVIGETILRTTRVGRALYGTGANAVVASLSGIAVRRYQLSAFMLTGLLSALAGILLMAQIERADPTLGQGWELAVIAGVIIGGVSLQGGSGTIIGTVIGLLLVQVVVVGLVIVGFPSTLQTVATGVVLIVAVGADRWRRNQMSS